MNILKSVDIEDEIRLALDGYITAYVRPLPEDFIGGTTQNTIDSFLVRLSARAETDAGALTLLQVALGILEQRSKEQMGELRFSQEQNLISWGVDPVRPDLKLCQATVTVLAHKQIVDLDES